MSLLRDTHVRQLFEESNIEAEDHEKYRRVLERVLDAHGFSSSDVFAVSSARNLVMVCKLGIFLADERGIFGKRIDIKLFLPWSHVTEITQTRPSLKSFGIELRGESAARLLELRWSTGGPVAASEAMSENSRVYMNMMGALQADQGAGQVELAAQVAESL
jgi:hypothetical protein